MSEVEVIASKLDERKLNRVAMKFVESHAVVSPAIHQMSRWRAGLCPSVTGLTPSADAFVSRRVEEIARSVGARTRELTRNVRSTSRLSSHPSRRNSWTILLRPFRCFLARPDRPATPPLVAPFCPGISREPRQPRDFNPRPRSRSLW